jgi:aminodeoxyfutalosine deaminase
MKLRARIVAMGDRPAVEDGALILRGGEVEWAGPWRDARARGAGRWVDLGEVVVMPGLVNAHAHLDYTAMAGRLPCARHFADWIGGMLALKSGWGQGDYAASWAQGARMLVERGTTSVANVESVPELLPDVWSATPARVFSFVELTGVRSCRDPVELVDEAADRLARLPPCRGGVGLSPHAPYSARVELFRRARLVSEARGWRRVTHVAESREEYEMFASASGVLYEWLRQAGRDMSDCGHGSPVRFLESLGYLDPRLMAVHVNYLGEGDAERLGRAGASVVHCPRSHAYFGHERFPLEALVGAGVNVALGTDSLVTVRAEAGEVLELCMFEEMRALLKVRPGAVPEGVVRMATVNGGRAMGLEGKAGRLGSGSWADLLVLPVSSSLDGWAEAVVDHRGGVAGCMVAGEWAVRPSWLPGEVGSE